MAWEAQTVHCSLMYEVTCMSMPRRRVLPRPTVVPVLGMFATSSVASCCQSATRASVPSNGLNFTPSSLPVLIDGLNAA